MNTTVRRCDCGCGRIIKSTRPNAKYALPKCRMKALRDREREKANLSRLSAHWNDCFKAIGERYGEYGLEIQKRALDLARELTPEQADSVMRMLWDTITTENFACTGQISFAKGD